MDLFDTHCHLNHPDFAPDSAQVAERAGRAGVSRLLCIGYDLDSSRRAVALAAEAPAAVRIYAAAGIHPEAANEWQGDTARALQDLYARCPGALVAYGEIGLDYHWDTVPRARQQAVFAAQIAFARTLAPALPLVIHCRDAQADVLSLLREAGPSGPVVMHCFTGDPDAARDCLEAGCFLGIGGVATFKKADAVRAAIAFAPLDRLLLETDCPYLAPQEWRGRRNEPSYLPAVARVVATVKQAPVETVAQATTATALSLFGMDGAAPGDTEL